MTTTITIETIEHKGFVIDFHFPFHVVYQKGGRKILWEAMNITECRYWIDDFVEWINN